jgi:hypothetical protein
MSVSGANIVLDVGTDKIIIWSWKISLSIVKARFAEDQVQYIYDQIQYIYENANMMTDETRISQYMLKQTHYLYPDIHSDDLKSPHKLIKLNNL